MVNLIKTTAVFVCASLINLSFALANEKSPVVGPATYKLLQHVDKLIENSALAEALSQLQAMLPELDENSLDQAVILRSIASVYSQQGKYREAAMALEKSLASQALAGAQATTARWSLGELYAASEQFDKAAGRLESALKQVKSPNSRQYFLLASVYGRLKQYEKSALYLRKAIAGKDKPDESWYKMLLAILYEAGDYPDSVKVLQQLIEKFPPNKAYWLQLIALHHQMNQSNQALAVNELAYRKGLIKSADEILNLANLMSFHHAPYRAAELLEREIASGRLTNRLEIWEKVANAWAQAREFDRVVSALKKASESHSGGELDFRLGQIYTKQEKWKKAHTELSEALRKGGLKDPGNAHLLFGISCYELHEHQQARDSFIKAQQYSGARDSAKRWLNYIDSET